MEKVVKQTNQESTQQYPKKIFADQLITMDDLQQFKEQLFKELENLLKPHASLSKKWLKSHEVKRLLKIISGHYAKSQIIRSIVVYEDWRRSFL